MFQAFVENGWQSFVDKETGKCDFNSERFIRILKFCNTYPDKIDYNMSYSDNEKIEKVIFNIDYNRIHNFYSLRKAELVFGEPAAMVGYPDTEGNGAIVFAEPGYIVFEASPVKEGIWEFLRPEYLDEHQKLIVTGGEYYIGGISGGAVFPIKKSALEFAMEEAKR